MNGPDRTRVFALIRVDVLDIVRNPRDLATRLLPVGVLVVGMAFVAVLIALGGGDGEREDFRRLAVTEPLTGPLAAAAADAGLRAIVTVDPAHAVAEGDAEAGLVSTDDGFVVVGRGDDTASAQTMDRVRVALAVSDDATNRTPRRHPITVDEIEPSIESTRRTLSHTLPVAIVGLLGLALGTTAGRFARDHRTGVLAHQLTLPLSRRALVLTKAASETIATGLATAPLTLLLLAIATIAATASAGPGHGAIAFGVGASTALATLVGSGVAGVFVATRFPGAANNPLITFLPVGAASGIGLWFAASDTIPEVVALVPGLGLVDAFRHSLVGGVSAPGLLVSLATTTLGIGALATLAARAAGNDEVGMRAR